MSQVVLLRGVNVGGHKTFRPSVLAKELKCGAVSIGAAGSFVIRKPISRTDLRAAVEKRLPFDARVMMCDGSEILELASADPFARQPSGPNILQFVGLLEKRPRSLPRVPLAIPSARAWGVKILAVHNRFVIGICRREMKAIGYLGRLDTILGMIVTTRSWNTILKIARILEQRPAA